jgi:hypothetical protein
VEWRLDHGAEVATIKAGDLPVVTAYLRDVWEFRNLLLVERPNGDFGHALMRQFLFDAFHFDLLKGLTASLDSRVAEIAQKAAKEGRNSSRKRPLKLLTSAALLPSDWPGAEVRALFARLYLGLSPENGRDRRGAVHRPVRTTTP